MNYTTLTTNIKTICEQTFTDAQLIVFTQQAEQRIYNALNGLPALRKSVTGAITSGNAYLSSPTDMLYPLELAVVSAAGAYIYLVNKDVNFIREAYPTPATTGVPKYYAIFSDGSFILGPTPNASLATELHYSFIPESIVTATTTWLGDNFDSALLNGALVEAIRFQKGEPDVVAMYDKLYVQSIALLKNLSDGKLRQDTYRSGQQRVTVN